jgi:sugar lactone lactonase YvrE
VSEAGIWNGTAYSNVAKSYVPITGIIAENHRAQFVSVSAGTQYAGTVSMSGTTLSGQATAYAPFGSTFLDGTHVGPVTISASVNQRVSINGSFSGVGDNGTISLTYDSHYVRPSSFATIQGTWQVNNDAALGTVQFVISSTGTATGSTGTGCLIAGGFSILNPAYNAYQVDISLSNCGTGNGTYFGLATLTDTSVQNDTMITGISNATTSIVGAFRRQATMIGSNNNVTTIAGTALVNGSADGTGAAARFNLPFGITTDGTNLYVADTYNNTVRKIVISTGAVTTIAGTAGTTGSADGTGTAATFLSPTGITTDGANLYVTDYGNNTVRKIVIATGAVTTIAGTAGTTGSADGTGAAASFYVPAGITTDTDGTNLYVADYGNSTIRKIVIATGAVTTIAGTAGVFGPAEGTGNAASFSNPFGLTTDGTNLYVVDTNNSTIRKIVISTRAVTTMAGTAGAPGFADGTGNAASFAGPFGITTDGANLYVADTNNSTIRKIVISTGAVTTVAGTATVMGSADGVGGAASFNSPAGIIRDGTNLYVVDTSNSTIRKIY